MLNIMLVDDEVLALEYLKHLVDWEKYGYHVAGCASGAKKALELYDKIKPEIVISDIRMPVMDGLELTQKLKEKNRDVELILVSAYGDFEYAKKGIAYGVANYILKHELCEELLLAELGHIRERIFKKRQEEKIFQNYFAHQLIYGQGDYQSEEGQKLGNRLFLLFLHKRNSICCGEWQEEAWTQEEYETVRAILEEGMEGKIFYAADMQITSNNWLILYKIEHVASIYTVDSLIGQKCAQIGYRLKQIPDIHFNIVYSYEITQAEISETFRRMSHQIRDSVFWKINEYYPIREIPQEKKKIAQSRQMQGLKDAVYSSEGDPAGIVRRMFENLGVGERTDSYKALMTLLNHSLREIREAENIRGGAAEEKLYTIEEIIVYYEESFEQLHAWICREEMEGCSRLIQEIQRYIWKHYEQELSLELLGETFQMNGVYLGQIFRKEVGTTFLKYLTGIRIEEAKRFLKEEHCSVAETAQRVGYKTSQYFSKVFVKAVGMTPQEYKRWEEKKEKENV